MMTKLCLGPMFIDENNQVLYGYESALERIEAGLTVHLVTGLRRMNADQISTEYMIEQLQDAERDSE